MSLWCRHARARCADLDVYLPGDLTDLMVFMGNVNPREAIDDFHYVNPEFDLKQDMAHMDPLQTLKAVLQIFVSDRWASRDH